MTAPANSSLLALRAQQSAEIKRLRETPDVYSAFIGSTGFLSGGTPRPLTKTQLLVRQPVYTRRQPLPSNFTKFLVAKQWGISEATTLPLIDLLAKLETDQPKGLRFVAVGKNSTRHRHVVTVLDLAEKRFYRAASLSGMAGVLKDIAKRRPAVKLLAASEVFRGE